MIKLPIFYYFGMYRGIWKYVSMSDLIQIIKANLIATAIFVIAEVFLFGLQGYPRSVFIVDFVLCTTLVAGLRFLTRMLRERVEAGISAVRKKVLVVGAGEAGVLMFREYRHNPSMGEVVGFIDDDPLKRGETIHGVKIYGNRKDIPIVAAELAVEEIIIAMPSAKGEVIRDIISYCQIPDIN